jgi:hypothetical protein
MSDDKISLEFLGEQMLRMQADLRGVRSEQVRLESEQTSMRADLRHMQATLVGLDGSVKALDRKLDNFMASVDARFDQVNQTSATNLAITLEAIKGLDRKIESRD